MKTIRLLTFLMLVTVFCAEADAQHQKTAIQTRAKIAGIKKSFEGLWYNQKTRRYISISFDYGDDALINDWRGKLTNRSTADAYIAFIKGNKLILPEEKEHHGVYCEMLISKRKLLYKCKGLLLKTDQFTDSTSFVKLPD
ncbi:hypothetical protein [Pedobacter lusitanus]|uniref:hypothetical protein n=1 Tax=Pedobacter lusitanus TaxID=1503925 RepID=UPI001269BDAA|nr:hypothetical protein [Pedobacter lusitanus]